MIFEAVIITRNADGSLHIVPMGYREAGEDVGAAPFRPSNVLTGTPFDSGSASKKPFGAGPRRISGGCRGLRADGQVKAGCPDASPPVPVKSRWPAGRLGVECCLPWGKKGTVALLLGRTGRPVIRRPARGQFLL